MEVCAAAFGSGPKEEVPTRSLFLLLVSWTFWTSYKLVLSLLSPLIFYFFFHRRCPRSPQRTRDLSVSKRLKGGVIFVMPRPSPPSSSAQGNQGSGIAPEPHPSTIQHPFPPPELPARKRTYTKMYKDVCLEYIYMKHKNKKRKILK